MIRTIPQRALFGTQTVWRGRNKISVSDPTRTIIDLLVDVKLGGGIRPATDIFSGYVNSSKRDIDLLIEYAKRIKSGAVFKRLGFLLETQAPNESRAIDACRENMTKGNAKLDPSLDSKKLITRWRLWVPSNWERMD